MEGLTPIPVRFVTESPETAPREPHRGRIGHYAGRCTVDRSLRGPETRGTVGCCIRSKSSRLPVHPFRDVNTRSQHIMFNQLARDAGWVIDWSQIPGDVFAHARTLAIVEDHTGIDALIRPNLHRLDAGGRAGEAVTVEQVRSFQARGVSRTPDVLDRELDAARRRRSHSAAGSFGTGARRPEPPTPHGGLSL